MLVQGKEVLDKAHRENYAVGAFNVNNMEILQAIISAAEKMKSPVFIQASEGALEYAGLDTLANMMLFAARKSSVPVVVHLDHGKDLEVVKKCIELGFSSVMFDGSHYDFEENVRLTKQVVDMAHPKGISVEAELGTIGGTEDKVTARHIVLTDPDKALEFVQRTQCDSLAIAIGTSHGPNKFQTADAKLDLERLKEIKAKVNVPLVLHGASSVPREEVDKAAHFGAKFAEFYGVPEAQIVEAIKISISKINTDTDLRIAFTAAIREVIIEKPQEFDPRKFLGPAREEIQHLVEHRMTVFGSAGKA
jgi:fructose-bisphosphate aldolase class II